MDASPYIFLYHILGVVQNKVGQKRLISNITSFNS
jgi:hypothetical protein